MIRTFKIESIIGEVEMMPDVYEIPPDFKALDYFDAAWGVYAGKRIETVKLRFNARSSETVQR
jgi:hypothetical protein